MASTTVGAIYLMTDAMVNATRQEYLIRFPFTYQGFQIRDILRVGRNLYRLSYTNSPQTFDIVPGDTLITRTSVKGDN